MKHKIVWSKHRPKEKRSSFDFTHLTSVKFIPPEVSLLLEEVQSCVFFPSVLNLQLSPRNNFFKRPLLITQFLRHSHSACGWTSDSFGHKGDDYSVTKYSPKLLVIKSVLHSSYVYLNILSL